MARTLTLSVLTPEGVAITDEAVSIVAPGERGYLGMLFNHAPLVTTLQPGTLSWRQPAGATRALAIGAGLLEVVKNRVTVLTSTLADPTPSTPRA